MPTDERGREVLGVRGPSADGAVRGGGDDGLVEVAKEHCVDPVGMGLR